MVISLAYAAIICAYHWQEPSHTKGSESFPQVRRQITKEQHARPGYIYRRTRYMFAILAPHGVHAVRL